MRTATRVLAGYDHAEQGRRPYPPAVSLRVNEPLQLVLSDVCAGEHIASYVVAPNIAAGT